MRLTVADFGVVRFEHWSRTQSFDLSECWCRGYLQITTKSHRWYFELGQTVPQIWKKWQLWWLDCQRQRHYWRKHWCCCSGRQILMNCQQFGLSWSQRDHLHCFAEDYYRIAHRRYWCSCLCSCWSRTNHRLLCSCWLSCLTRTNHLLLRYSYLYSSQTSHHHWSGWYSTRKARCQRSGLCWLQRVLHLHSKGFGCFGQRSRIDRT